MIETTRTTLCVTDCAQCEARLPIVNRVTCWPHNEEVINGAGDNSRIRRPYKPIGSQERRRRRDQRRLDARLGNVGDAKSTHARTQRRRSTFTRSDDKTKLSLMSRKFDRGKLTLRYGPSRALLTRSLSQTLASVYVRISRRQV